MCFLNCTKGSLEKWIKFFVVVERLALNRMKELDYGAYYYEKGATYQRKDRQITTLIKKYKKSKITQKEYIQKIRTIMGDYNLRY